MLKNDGTLPLPSSVKMVALIGPWADATNQMLGNYAGVPPFFHSPVYAAQQAGFSVMYSIGADINSTNTTGFAAALAISKQADAVVYAGGIDISIEAEAMVRSTLWCKTLSSQKPQLIIILGPLYSYMARRPT